MLSEQQTSALTAALAAAKAAQHIWPGMAACEAMVETGWMQSGLVKEANNVFGMKQHVHPIFGTITLPTREFLSHAWVVVEAPFIHYPDLASSFADRMATLERLKGNYLHYAAALSAATPEAYVTEVSRTWSTDPNRAETCIAIYSEHRDLLS